MDIQTFESRSIGYVFNLLIVYDTNGMLEKANVSPHLPRKISPVKIGPLGNIALFPKAGRNRRTVIYTSPKKRVGARLAKSTRLQLLYCANVV